MSAPTPAPPQRDIYTISRLLREARAVLEGSFPPLWIEGEISNLSRPSSGHIYFSLKDKAAQVRCAMFRSRSLHLRFRVHDEKAFYSFQGVAGHAGLFSTAEELAVLMALSLQGGGYGWQQFFTPATLAQFIAPSPYDHRFGLGWRTAVQGDLNWHFGAYASDSAYGHTGWTGTATVIDPEQQLLVVLLTNKKHSPIVAEGDSSRFSGDSFETGRYGSILTLIYQALP